MFLLLNLNTREYTLNLNKENIDTSLKIIESLAKLHSEFWNKPIKQTFTFLHLFSFTPFYISNADPLCLCR